MSRYSLRACEQEVTIRFDMEEKVAHIYASAPNWIRKYDRLCEEFPAHYKCVKVDELGYFKKYECPMKLMNPRKPRTVTEAQKERGRELWLRRQANTMVSQADNSGEDFIDDDMSDEET